MSLFWKIFLWFLLAMASVVGVSIFVSWSTQTEPFIERWRTTTTGTMNVYTETAKQIYDIEGETGAKKFLQTIENSHQNRNVCLVTEKDKSCLAKMGDEAQGVIQKALESSSVEFDLLKFEENYAAKKFNTAKGETFVLVLKMDFPRPPPPFGADWKTRLVRIFAILLTAALVCYALAQYLVKPILLFRRATKRFADGDLQVRSNIKRRDEIGQLSRDFDEMAERIESLIVSQKNLTRDISHELRSPLARMNVALELAKNRENKTAFLERIETESQRLNEMISNILTLSKLESKTANVEKQEVNLTKLVESVVEDVSFEAEGKGKSVKILKAEKSQILGNERLLQSAIENVLRNALRYTKDIVEVSLQVKEKQAVIAIKDYGEGIPESELKEIFRPFYRVSQARERKSGGIGLGLAITEQAVRAHEGSVTAKNTGNGLCVEISLPCERQ